MFEALLQRLDHGGRVKAVHEAMIERRRKIHDPAHGNRAVQDDWTIDGLVDADDRDFRCVDDRRGGDAAQPEDVIEVTVGEKNAAQVFESQAALQNLTLCAFRAIEKKALALMDQ